MISLLPTVFESCAKESRTNARPLNKPTNLVTTIPSKGSSKLNHIIENNFEYTYKTHLLLGGHMQAQKKIR